MCRSTPINRECALMMIFNEFPLMKRAGPLRGRISAFHFFFVRFFLLFFLFGWKTEEANDCKAKKKKTLNREAKWCVLWAFL